MAIRKLFSLFDASSRQRRDEFDRLMSKADSLRDSGDFSRAVDAYGEVLKFEPGATEVRVQLGNMAKDTGQFDLAMESYRQAVVELGSKLKSGSAAVRDEVQGALADVHCQLGHLQKRLGNPKAALEAFRASRKLAERADVDYELKYLEATIDDILMAGGRPSIEGLSSVRPQGVPAGIVATIAADELFNAPVTNLSVRSSACQCPCWSSLFAPAEPGWVECSSCGTRYSMRTVYLNDNAMRILAAPLVVSSGELAAVAGTLNVSLAGKSVALVNTKLEGATPEGWQVQTLEAYSNGIADRGLPRLSYDVIMVPQLSYAISDTHGLIEDCFRLLKPNGVLVVGFSANPAGLSRWAASFDGGKEKPEAEGIYAVERGHRFYDFNPETVMGLLRIEGRGASLLGRCTRGAHCWVAVSKAASMSMGVMSGIGDASWSFMFAEAVRKKYDAEKVVLHIHDSGDFRARRSNNMLARFSFINELAGSRFDIHASPPMDDATGHINYHPGGPSRLDSTDEFDYRLVFNTYLEHGWSADQICARFELDPKAVDYNFFEKYIEKEDDLRGYNRMKQYVGEDYIVFHFGATKDNSEVGLNRGEIWTPQDWIELGRKLHETYKVPIVIIGAAYDLDYGKKILSRTDDAFYYNTMGQLDITETLSVIMRARFIVSFPSGVGIVGPYLRVPTVIFWRDKANSYHPMHARAGFEPEFSHNWVPPDVLEAGTYYNAWYGTDTPASIHARITQNNWWDANPRLSAKGKVAGGKTAAGKAVSAKPRSSKA